MGAWWLRSVVVLQSPSAVFVALRRDGAGEVSDRSETVLAIVMLAGVAFALSTSTAAHLLDDSDYDPTATEDEFGAKVVAALAKLGVRGKHFIVNTDENGQPLNPDLVKGKGINDAPMCHGRIQTACQRTGIPPTINVASTRWHLGTKAAQDAKRYCDAYVWSGQPWDIDDGPFVPQYALWLAANGEY